MARSPGRSIRWPVLMLGAALRACGAAGPGTELRLVSWNVQNGVGAPGSAAFAAVRETLERLSPDVIAFQEIDVQNPVASDPAHFGDVRALLASLGFSTTRAHLATAGDGFQAQAYVSGDFGNGSQSLAVASRHSITRTVQIGRGVGGRREMTRFPLFVRIDVPDTEEDLDLVVVHLKQGDTQADEFRRGVEALRVREFLAEAGVDGGTRPVLVVGDMNEELNEPQTAAFSTAGVAAGHVFRDGSALPAAYLLGPDVADPLVYAVFPTSGFAPAGLSVVPALQTDGVTDRTYTFAGDSRLDYIFAGKHTRSAGVVRAEAYHSGREPVGDGLPKAPAIPEPALSLLASDHLPLVADFVMGTLPVLEVALPVSMPAVGFEPAAEPLHGLVTVPTAPTEPLVVSVSPFRQAPLQPISPVVIPAGERSATFPLILAGSPFVPDRRITLVATAEGYRDGLGTLATRGAGVAGPLRISQYTETPSGSAPKAIEVMNVTAREIHFSAEPLQVVSYASGSRAGVTEVLAEFGRLPAGAVVVIGDTATGRHLVAQGLLGATDAAVANAATNTVFTDTGEPGGRAVYVKRGFLFNGDDALEVRLNARRCDVFGSIGQDPGAAWTQSGVSTTNQNLSRRRSALAPSAGWTNPALVFETSGASLAAALTGFGVAPVLDDPYADWAAARGLAGASAAADADPDGNGLANAVEFAFGALPGRALELGATDAAGWQPRISLEIRSRLGSLRWGVEAAEEARGWRTVWEEGSPLGAPADVFRPITLLFPPSAASGARFRFFVIRP